MAQKLGSGDGGSSESPAGVVDPIVTVPVVTVDSSAGGAGDGESATASPPATTGAPVRGTNAAPQEIAAGSGSAAEPASRFSSASTQIDATIRTPTTTEPLRVWIGGDSMSGALGYAFRRIAADVGVMVVAPPDIRVSTGLSRPDFFNWSAYLRDDILTRDYEILIVMVGANDSQSLRQPNGSYCARFGQCWLDTYRSRVAAAMDLVRDPGGNRLLVWVGQPIMGPSSALYGIEKMNYLYWDEARKRRWVSYFDAWAYFIDPSGAYAHYLQAADGTEAEVRAGDEIHFTRAGGYRLAWAVMERIGEIVDLSNGTFKQPARLVAPAWVSERAEVPPAVAERID